MHSLLPQVGNVRAVFLFEWRRSFTGPRIGWWLLLACFPACMVVLIQFATRQKLPREPWIIFLFVLIPMLVTMLGAFLWTTPAISSELERRSWAYLAVRPHGGVAVLLGKYLAAVTWVVSAALVGLVLALLMAPIDRPLETGLVIARLALLASPAYAAVYLVIGTLIPKRSMAAAVAYTLVLELVVSLAPAMINQLTVQYRLRSLLAAWTSITAPPGGGFLASGLISNAPPWHHVVILSAYTIILVTVAVTVLRGSEFTTSEESDV